MRRRRRRRATERERERKGREEGNEKVGPARRDRARLLLL